MKEQIRHRGKHYLYFAGLAFLFLTICSRSSFLYPCNNWDDANSYFSMGKFMMNQGVIYRDLYDQKGPYLYFLYGIAYLLSPTSFLGVFFLEVAAVTLFLAAAYQIASLYCRKETALILLPLLAFGCLSAKSFYWGGAAEEFCLPLFGWSLYFSLRYFRKEYPQVPDSRMVLLNGIFAGVIMQVKFNLLGFYFAWMGIIALLNLNPKKAKKAVLACGTFLGGMLIPFFPWLIYFGLHGALDDWYTCYLYNNIFLYSDFGKASAGIGEKVYTLAKILYYLILDNPGYFLLIIAGMLFFLLNVQIKWQEKVNLYVLFGLLFLGIFIGGANLPYYSLPLMVFAAVGIGGVGRIGERAMEWMKGKERRKGRRQKPVVWTAGICVLSLWAAAVTSMNPSFMQQKKEEFFLFKFSQIVNQEQNPTLLNYNCLDAGLYTVANIVPNCKYFQTNGIPLKEMEQEQLAYMAEGRTQFVLIRGSYPEVIQKHYRLAAKETYMVNGEAVEYFLFKRK